MVTRLTLILVFQAVMVAATLHFDSSPRRWLPGSFAAAAMLVPFIGYIAAVYKVPRFGKWSRVLKTGVLTLFSILATMGGYTLLFLLGLWIKGDLHQSDFNQNPPDPTGPLCFCGVTNFSRFSPPGGGFSVLMPSAPTASITTNHTPAGTLVIHQFTAETSRVVAFSVLYNSFPTNLNLSAKKRIFDAGLKAALGADGQLLSDTPIALHGNEGREWKFDRYRGQALITVREYLVGNKLYQAICVMPKKRACNRHIQEFLDSFDLKEQ